MSVITVRARATKSGSTASISRAPTCLTAERNTPRIAIAINNPITGSAHDHPIEIPSAPITTASEVKPSVRACNPSATKAADPICRPTRIRYRATSSLPANPITPATATAHTYDTSRGFNNRLMASHPASTLDKVIIATTNNPARSSARPYP